MKQLILTLWCFLSFNVSLFAQKRYADKLHGIVIKYSSADSIDALQAFTHGRCEDYYFSSPAMVIFPTSNRKIKYVKLLSDNKDKVLSEGFRMEKTKLVFTPIFHNKPCFIPTIIKLMPRRIKTDIEIGDWIFYDINGVVVYKGSYKEYLINAAPTN